MNEIVKNLWIGSKAAAGVVMETTPTSLSTDDGGEGEGEGVTPWGYSRAQHKALKKLERAGIDHLVNVGDIDEVPTVFTHMSNYRFPLRSLVEKGEGREGKGSHDYDYEGPFDVGASIEPLLQYIKLALDSDRGVLIYCDDGIERSSVVTIIYLMWTQGWDYATGAMLLRAIRPCIDPSKYEKYILQFQERSASRRKQEVGKPDVGDDKYDGTSHSHRQVGSKRGREERYSSPSSSPKSKRAHLTTTSSPSSKEVGVQAKTSASGNDSLLLARILTVATRAARAGGRIMADLLGVELSLTTKVNKSDLVTNIDKQCQKVIEEMIIANFGSVEHGILGEESVAAGREAAGLAINEFVDKYDWLWIVDPIDGTTNFINGIPLSVVSIGVAYRGEVKVACIYDPYREEIFTAVKGQGAFMNGRKSSVSSVSIENAVIGVGVSCSPEAFVPEIRVLSALLPRCRTARNLGSACLHLAWISAGRLDAYYELDLNSWDLSAGSLLIQEAGGHVTDARGGRYLLQTRNILACNSSAALHGDLIGIITSCNAQDIQKS